jgi:hypothetical protein
MIKTRLWIKPDTGEERHYLQNWREAIGLEITWFNTGNIRWAFWDGKRISNTRASQIAMKPWFDSEGKLHVDSFSSGRGTISLDEAKKRILRYVQEHGGLDFLAG